MPEEIKEIEEQEQKGGEPDYKALYEAAKAESQKWERRSKKNIEKAEKMKSGKIIC